MTKKTSAPTEEQTNGYTEREQRHYHEITALNTEVRDAQTIFLRDNEEAKASRKLYEKLTVDLQQLISAGPDPQGILPGMNDDDDDAWGDTAVAVALEELTEKQLAALRTAGISTMGEVESLRAGEGLTSLGGIGERTAEKIEEQILGWLAARQA